MRGDHLACLLLDLRGEGLPPRARGSPGASQPGPELPGPTPACAGITASVSRSCRATSAYPRVRGDHLKPSSWPASSSGLPPRARGSPNCRGRPASTPRPTPACAGITRTPASDSPGGAAYPRVRGDHAVLQAVHATRNGLPPRARGSHQHQYGHHVRRGPTPACAGITRAVW